MFCKVTLMGDARSQNTQLMKAVRAIATAIAGSTPSVTGSTVYNSATTGQYEVITTVLDNSVAGGWTVKSDQTTLTSSVVSTNAFLESLLLYRDTGKSGLPYLWFSMIEGAYTSTNINYGPFLSFGYATTLANCNYGSGHNVTTNWSGTHSDTRFSACMPLQTGVSSNYDYVAPVRMYDTSTRVYYISATAEYIHIQQDLTVQNSYNSGAWFHLGLRTNSSWEDNYSDNPYWVAVWNAQNTNNYTDTAGYWTVMRPINTSTGVVGNSVNIWRYSGVQTNLLYINPVTGQQNASYSNGDYQKYYSPNSATNMYINYPTNYTSSATNGGTGYTQATAANMSTNGLQAIIYQPIYLGGSIAPSIGITSDSTTNALITPALPMYIRYQGNSNFGGYLKNLFQGGTFSDAAQLDLYHVIDAPYTIDGSTYIGIRQANTTAIGNAKQLLYVKAS